MPQNATEKNLTPKQRAAITALLTHTSKTAAAKAVGVNRSTLARWERDPDFTAALREAEGRVIFDISRRLSVLARQAVDTLGAAMRGEANAGQRAAANAVVTHLLKVRELATVEERLQEMEARLATLEALESQTITVSSITIPEVKGEDN